MLRTQDYREQTGPRVPSYGGGHDRKGHTALGLDGGRDRATLRDHSYDVGDDEQFEEEPRSGVRSGWPAGWPCSGGDPASGARNASGASGSAARGSAHRGNGGTFSQTDEYNMSDYTKHAGPLQPRGARVSGE